jgi:hypothetical protein
MTVSGFSFARFAARFPELVVNWVLAEPLLALGILTFLATWRRRQGSLGELAAFGIYPAAVFVALGTTYTEVRYSLSTTPFLVVLAALGLTSVRPRLLRAPLVALAVAVPLATAARYDWLLTKPDSRIFLDGVLPALAGAGCQVAVEDSLRLPAARFPPKISQFPPNGDYSKWAFGRETPVATLRSLDSNVFVCATGSSSPYEVPEHALRALGFVLCARLPASPSERTVLPDAPENLIASIWRAKRSGPTLDFYSKGEAFRRLQAMLAAESIVKFRR